MRCLSLLFLLLSCDARADIYKATSESGVDKWSTQAFDAAYQKTSIVENLSLVNPKREGADSFDKKIKDSEFKANSLKRSEYRSVIFSAANKYVVDLALIEALISVESGFNTNAISPKGARGLMQLMPATAKRYGMKNEQELHVPSKNIDMGVRHLKDLLNLHNGQVALAIAAYNAGQGAVTIHGQRIPSYRETMLYVPAVMAYIARHVDSAQSFEY